MRVPFQELESVIRPWAGRHGFRFLAVVVEGEPRARIESEDARLDLRIEVFALDAFGNVAVDIVRGADGARHAYTGPLPDLLHMLEEARHQGQESETGLRDLN